MSYMYEVGARLLNSSENMVRVLFTRGSSQQTQLEPRIKTALT